MNGLQIFEYNGTPIEFEIINGQVYANATAMCQAFDKEVRMWTRLESTQEYLQKLGNRAENARLNFLEIKEGRNGGTWIHQKLIVKMARWLDVDFEIWCDDKIAELMRTGETKIQRGPGPVTEEVILGVINHLQLKIEEQKQVIELQAPKAEHFDKAMDASGNFSIGEAAKTIKDCGENRLFKFLREMKILFRENNRNQVNQRYINNGWFVVKHKTYEQGGLEVTYPMIFITPYGLPKIRLLWEGRNDELPVAA